MRSIYDSKFFIMATSTGDMKNNLMKLLREIRRMRLQLEPDVQGLSLGSPSSFLSLLHTSMMHYSLPLANWFTHHGYDLYGRSDLRFLQELYRVLRDIFCYHPKLTKEQFLSVGFAERKVLMTRDVLLFCQAKHAELTSSSSQTARKRYGNITATTTEVLTVQDMLENFKVGELSSSVLPPTMKITHSFPEHVTPLPSHQSSPEQQDTQLETVNITTHVIRHGSPDSIQELPHSNTINISEEKEERTNSSPASESWSSLPQHRAGDASHRHNPPNVVGNRVEELTKMVEKLSAKFILLETHLKLTQSQVQLDADVMEPPRGCESNDVTKVEDVKRSLSMEQALSQPQTSPMKQVSQREQLPEVAQLPSVQRGQPSHVHTWSTYLATPSTPEETKRLIESLRTRAKETKQLLHLATLRLHS